MDHLPQQESDDDQKLPNEILRHIISFIPLKEKGNMMLVNKAMYQFGCELEAFKYPLVLNNDVVS